MRRVTVLVLTLALVVAAAGPAAAAGTHRAGGHTTVTLMTHDSFNVSKKVLAAFEQRSGIEVKILHSGDAGAAVNQAILTKGDPLGDVFFGVDNTLLSRALDEGVFEPYDAPALAKVNRDVQLDPTHHVTPIDTGDVCINYDKRYYAKQGLAAPASLDDLTKSTYDGQLVVENPATSSPGLAFLLATVAQYGEQGWQDYWQQLRENGVKVVDGWEQAYNEEFSGASASKGDYPLVVSYASSPPAEVIYAKPRPKRAPTASLLSSCFRQIEFAGILDGTSHRRAAEKVVDFMLSRPFQEDMPLQMFVYPVRQGATLPPAFVKYAQVPPKPLTLAPTEIAANRDRWIDEWTDIVLR